MLFLHSVLILFLLRLVQNSAFVSFSNVMLFLIYADVISLLCLFSMPKNPFPLLLIGHDVKCDNDVMTFFIALVAEWGVFRESCSNNSLSCAAWKMFHASAYW